MNHLASLNKLNNQYFTLRHGKSIANQKKIIVSSPNNGIENYGLSDIGKKQVKDSIIANKNLNKKTKIISSDFLRAFESAKIAYQYLDSESEIQLNEHLRERFFGNYELKGDHFYQNVWDNDLKDSSHTMNDVESADAVMQRTTSLILDLENTYQGETFLLASHGDALQILQAGFNKVPAATHRSLPHLETAEIRELILRNS